MLQLTANNTPLIISKVTNFNLTLKSPLSGDNTGSYVLDESEKSLTVLISIL